MPGTIYLSTTATHRVRHATFDLQRYLMLATGEFLPISSTDSVPGDDSRLIVGHAGDKGLGDDAIGQLEIAVPSKAEGYALKRHDDTVVVAGADEAGAVYGVYGLLEEAYGCGFFLGSEVVPEATMPLLPASLNVQRSPAFSTRGLLPWYDFLSGPTAWNLEDYKLYVDRMVRMGLNFLGLHVYSTGSVNRSGGAEPFLSFEYHGVGHDGYLDTTQTSRWGYLPMRASQFSYGSERFYSGEVFGADAAIEAQGSLDAARRGKQLLSDALKYAKRRGLKICVGFEPAAIPDEILNALPASAKQIRRGWKGMDIEVLDLTTEVAREILHIRLDDVLDTYPEVDAIWLWQNEDAAWTTQRSGEILPFDASYLQEAHRYLSERAPNVTTVVSGWGAVHGLFDTLHQELPTEIAFSALHHNLGTSETDEVYGRLGDRQRWPIPWLEDDATLWHPQYYVDRFRNDVERAARFGADGMIGIHWRTRVIDHIASYFARALWHPGLDTAEFYRWYADRLVGSDHCERLAAQLDHVDRTSAWPGYLSDDHVGSIEWSHGHSNEAGAAFNPLSTPDPVIQAFNAFADELARLQDDLQEPAPTERLHYHTAQVEFVRHYVASQQQAAAIDAIVEAARSGERTLTDSEFSDASQLLEGLFSSVRYAVESFMDVQTTTADLGVLASLNQKYVTRAIWQRIDAVCEVAEDPEQVPEPDLSPREEVPLRVFVPVPPEVMDDDGAPITAIVSDPHITSVELCISPLEGGETIETPLSNKGRGVWTGRLRSCQPVRYCVEAKAETGKIVRAPESTSQYFSAIVAEG